ncbi:MAG: hypothetical protein HY669_03785 [Chloroflexi bacterium]|nr:hypothetical protein [Chloroflexota bacterium]
METGNRNGSLGFLLPTIRKVKMIEDRHEIPPDAESQVNQLLLKGWVLLALHTKEISAKHQLLVFTLGHTDASADDMVRAIYPTPEEIR